MFTSKEAETVFGSKVVALIVKVRIRYEEVSMFILRQEVRVEQDEVSIFEGGYSTWKTPF